MSTKDHPFLSLGVPADLVKGADELGIKNPTPVQREVIPHLLEDGRDFIAQAQTGTGKTAAFGLPLLTKIDPKSPKIQGLILAPTRELAKQIQKQLFRFTKYSERIFSEVLSGGDPIDRQCAALRRPTHIIVATPGRLTDLVSRKAVDLSEVQFVVLDEADEMLSMGFQKDLDALLKLATPRRGTWLFSATFPTKVEDLVRNHLSQRAPFVKVAAKEVVNRNIEHQFVILEPSEKDDFIDEFLLDREGEFGLIFCRTKAGAIALGNALNKRGHDTAVLQGDLTQPERDKVMRAFRKKRVPTLIATDVAARGLDVADLAFVIHHRLPDNIEYYTHRSGRTARAGKGGLSLVLLEPKQRPHLGKFASDLHIHFGEYRLQK